MTRRSRLLFSLPAIACILLTATASTQAPWPTRGWERATPQEAGLDPKPLLDLDAAIAGGQYGYVDSLLVIRRGRLAFERTYSHDWDRIYGERAATRSPLNAHDPSGQYNYFNPWWHPTYRRGDLHSLQSVTKTMTSVIIGVAVTRNEFPPLDTPVLSFFDTSSVANVDERKRRITIRHLLTMTDGMEWFENLPYTDPNNTTVKMEASFDWIQLAIDQPMAHEPGTRFNYNSGASQLLSHIFRRATGTDIEEYAHRHLFTPLGIERYFWKRTPMGLPDTEGGLYLRPQDLAKIAYLFLRNGTWDGRTLVSPEWVKASVTPATRVSDGVQYGYKWWLYDYGPNDPRLAWAGSGFGGQHPIILPDRDLIVVVTGWHVQQPRRGLGVRTILETVLAASR